MADSVKPVLRRIAVHVDACALVGWSNRWDPTAGRTYYHGDTLLTPLICLITRQ